jgi:hypothetical protein
MKDERWRMKDEGWRMIEKGGREREREMRVVKVHEYLDIRKIYGQLSASWRVRHHGT